VQIVTRNGARILGKDRETGFIASARHADLVIARGDPVRAPKAMHEVVTVFKGALADDCMKLRRAAKGLVDSL
jgi:imidazolonepropionase-like amidohydrolase